MLDRPQGGIRAAPAGGPNGVGNAGPFGFPETPGAGNGVQIFDQESNFVNNTF